jgi:outer membrane receptor protein involved in Fe transport
VYFESFFGRRFSAGLRFDYSEAPADIVNTSVLYLAPLSANPDQIRTYSLFVTWMPSEFHRLRLQLDQVVARDQPDDQRITLQWTAFLGSHSHGFTTR